MVGSLILAAALMGQAPAPKPATEATANERMIAKRRAKKAGAYARRLDREHREAVAEEKAIAAAKKEYKEMLPYMLENQRQLLERQSALERNAALDRIAGAQAAANARMDYWMWRMR